MNTDSSGARKLRVQNDSMPVHGHMLKHARNNNNKKAATFYGQDMSGVKKLQHQHPTTYTKVKIVAYEKRKRH